MTVENILIAVGVASILSGVGSVIALIAVHKAREKRWRMEAVRKRACVACLWRQTMRCPESRCLSKVEKPYFVPRFDAETGREKTPFETDPDLLWCEDCRHFGKADMGGEGECSLDGHDTWYGCPICERYEGKGGMQNDDHL